MPDSSQDAPSATPADASPAGAGTGGAVAYLAEKKLFVAAPGAEKPALVESHFVEEMLDRRERNRQRHEWRQSGMAWNFRGMVPGTAGPTAAGSRPVRFECVAPARAGSGELIYAIQTDAVGGLFYWERKTGYERRLFHRAHFQALDVACHPADGTLAVAVRTEDGAANLALMNREGRGMREVTGGDSVDECPSWQPGADRHVLVYQSSGLGRGAHGMVVERGPYAVHRLDTDGDTDGGGMETLLESDEWDYLSPKLGPDGSLYYIARPYQPLRQPVSALKVAKDVVLFPFRLVLAVVHFLDWFSMVFRRKPLLTAAGPPNEGPDARYMMLWGKLVDAEHARREKWTTGDGGPGALVPKTWTLHRRSPDGSDAVLTAHVVSYDLGAGGSVVYTDGTTVYRLAPDGTRSQLCRARLIERVVSIPDELP
jgi:hypothetical protein